MTGDTLSLLARCRRLGLQFTMNGDRLHVDGPVGMATPELRHELRRHKEDIIRVLMLLDDGSTGAVHGSAPRFASGCPVGDANDRIDLEGGADRLAGCGEALDGEADGLELDADGSDFAAWTERHVKTELDDLDRLAVAVAVGDVAGWRYPIPAASLAGVPDGWTPDGWRRRLRYVADACQEDHPARAAELRQEADRLTT